MTESQSRFAWNAGAWFGTQLGGTLWILISGLMLLSHDSGVAWMVLSFFWVANMIGADLCRRRTSFSAYGCYQGLLALIGLAGIATVWVVDRAGLWGELQSGSQTRPGFMYVMIPVMVLGIMLMFHFRNRG